MDDQFVHIYVIVIWAKDEDGNYHNRIQGPDTFLSMPPVPRPGDLVVTRTDNGERHLSVDFVEYSYFGISESGNDLPEGTVSTATQVSIFAKDLPPGQSDLIRDVESSLNVHRKSNDNPSTI